MRFQHSRPPKYPRIPMVCPACGKAFLSSKKQAKDRTIGRSATTHCSRTCASRGALAASSRAAVPETGRDAHFWSKVDRSGDCWVWIRGQTTNGYGRYHMGRRGQYAHRRAWEMASGAPPPWDLVVLHTCDNRLCVRNDEPGTYLCGDVLLPRFGHLALGTEADNQRDAAAKDRIPHGSAHHHARLTTEAVVAIRRRYTGVWGQAAAMADEFGVHPRTIRLIASRGSWRHVP